MCEFEKNELFTDLGSLIRNYGYGYSKVWKFSIFPGTLILREINFGCYWGSKTTVSTILKALNYDFLKNFTPENVKKSQKFKIQSYSSGQNSSL